MRELQAFHLGCASTLASLGASPGLPLLSFSPLPSSSRPASPLLNRSQFPALSPRQRAPSYIASIHSATSAQLPPSSSPLSLQPVLQQAYQVVYTASPSPWKPKCTLRLVPETWPVWQHINTTSFGSQVKTALTHHLQCSEDNIPNIYTVKPL